MKTKILGLLAVGLLAGPMAAQAATVTFSFSNTVGSVAGAVTGTLTGLADSGTSAATGIVINSAPAGVGFSTYPVDVLALGWLTVANSITITGGVVTAASILVAGGTGSRAPRFDLNYSVYALNNIDGQRGVVNLDGFSAATFRVTPSRVPEPGTLALLGLGLAGLGVSRRRKAI